MRLGLFGGTFNPIHMGHLHAANEVKTAFELKKIYLIPSATPPHKEPTDIADAEDRLEMTRLSVIGSSDYCVADVELNRPGPSYTIDTVHYFRAVSPIRAQLYLIMGLDAFLVIDTWKFYLDLFKLIPFIVVSRPGFEECDKADWHVLEKYLVSKISSQYEQAVSLSGYVHPKNKPVFYLRVTPYDISSTEIRRRVKSGESIRGLVPDRVEEFIQQKGLYR
jgi:nicotinate-nucleotide adenylyltransferase